MPILAVTALFMAMTIQQDDFKFTSADKVSRTVSGLEYADTKVGTGPAAKNLDLAIVNYVLKLDDGKEVDSSKKPGRSAFRFTIGKGEVIKGWDEGLVGMKPGGIRKLHVPPSLGYGDKGAGSVIPGKAELWFTVELIALTPPASFAYTEQPQRSDTGLRYVDVIVGKGVRPAKGQKVAVHYTLYNENVERLETSLARGGKPLEFKLGSGDMIPGFDEGVSGMRVGGIRKLRVPASLAYGTQGSGPVQPGETIWFIVELVEIKHD